MIDHSFSASTGAPASRSRQCSAFAVMLGALLLLSSGCGALTFFAAPALANGSALAGNARLSGAIAIGLFFGLLLVVLGLAGVRGKRIAGFRLPSPWLFVALLLCGLLGGDGALRLPGIAPYLFPLLHGFCSVFLAAITAAELTRRIRITESQTAWAQLIWGGLGAGALAPLCNGAVSLLPQAASASSAQAAPAAFILVSVAARCSLVVLAPVAEEFLKSLGCGAALAWRRVSCREALLWGALAGAGFAIAETFVNVTHLPPEHLRSFWAVTMIARGGTTLLHMTASATVAIGWWMYWGGRVRAAALLYLAAALGHGLWNYSCIAFQSAPLMAGLSLVNLGWLALLLRHALRCDAGAPAGSLVPPPLPPRLAGAGIARAFLLLALIILALEFHNALVFAAKPEWPIMVAADSASKLLVWAIAFRICTRIPRLKTTGVIIVLAAAFLAPVLGFVGCAVMAGLARRHRRRSALSALPSFSTGASHV